MANRRNNAGLKLRRSLQLFPVKRKSLVMCGLVSIYSFAAIYVFNSLKHSPAGSTNHAPEESSFQSTVPFEFESSEDVKMILFWTKFYNDPSLDSYCITPNVLGDCPHSKCEFTTDRSLLKSSDAIVFHGRDLAGSKTIGPYPDKYIDPPRHRSSRQLWIFLMFEAPVHTWINLAPFDNVFNMTMTYRPDSDVYIPYGRLVPLDGAHSYNYQRLPNTGNSTKNKRLVAWSVSNCYKTPSRRNEVVHELHKYIPIDIYGDCGSLNCTPYTSLCDSGLECHEYLGSKYKFYLAFENSLCQDYITEKFYDSLYVGMVPIVYGYGDYSRVAPKGSYIDASDFPTMKSLGDYLLHLDRTPAEYEKYFEWRKQYRVQVSYFKQAWCSLCTKLWTDEGNQVHQVKNLSDWWLHKGSSNVSSGELKENACLNPTQLPWDPNMFSFYGFIYYPNYFVKVGTLYGLICAIVITCCFYIVKLVRAKR